MESCGDIQLFMYFEGSGLAILQRYIIFLTIHSQEKKIKRVLSVDVEVGSDPILSTSYFGVKIPKFQKYL